ncbi:MAG: DUF58 domain-containing protein [Oscillospiraceae bacterium]
MKINLKENVGFILNYLLVFGLSLIFALFLSGRIGWFLTLAFASAPVISFGMTYAQSRYLNMSVEKTEVTLNKGDMVALTINIENSAFLPSPSISVKISDSPGIKSSVSFYSVNIMPHDFVEINAEYKALIWGRHIIPKAEAYITDYMGLFRFPVKCSDTESSVISVIPDIPDYPDDCTAVRSAEEISALYDDSEETKESNMSGISGLPGFDNRDYVPGDPIKRINWKLSAKKDTLLVRMDDEIPCSRINVVLDSTYSEEYVDPVSLPYMNCGRSEAMMLNGQDTVELTLSVMRELVRRSFGISFFMWGEYGWERSELNDESDIAEVQLRLASYSFGKTSDSFQRFPEEIFTEGKSMSSVIFSTPCLDPHAAEKLQPYQSFITPLISSEIPSVKHLTV